MIEKEAEEWRNSLNYGIDNDTFYNIVIPCIEFGYNKANEWHYVKDGDLPKNDNKVLVLLKDGTIQFDCFYPIIKWCLSVNADVIAWKEIVLPKESE